MMRTLAAIVFALLVVATGSASARDGHGGGHGSSFQGHGTSGHGWHGGGHGHDFHHHHFGGSRVFFYGSYGPYWYPGWGFYRPYYYPYPYWAYYPQYPYAPSWAPEPPDDDDDQEYARSDVSPPDETEQASYGLVRLDGVQDGAAVDLDGRFWLTARDLHDRWLALPEGEHRIAVRVGDAQPIERTVRIVPGRMQVLKFTAPAERRG
jgi:hypothetical protein